MHKSKRKAILRQNAQMRRARKVFKRSRGLNKKGPQLGGWGLALKYGETLTNLSNATILKARYDALVWDSFLKNVLNHKQ